MYLRLKLTDIACNLFLQKNKCIKAVIENTTWLFFEKIIRIIVGLTVGAWIARYLEPERFGQLSYLLSLLGIFQVFSQLGLNNIAVRELAKKPELHGDIVGTLFLLRIVSGTIGYIASIICMMILMPNDNETLQLMSIISLSLIIQATDITDIWFQSQVKSKLTVIAKTASFSITNGMKILFILMELDLVYFAILVLAEAIVLAFSLMAVYKKNSKKIKWRVNLIIIKPLLIEAIPYLLSGTILAIYMQADKIIISSMTNQTQLGIYSASQSIINSLFFLPMIVLSSLAPLIAKKHTHIEITLVFRKIFSMLWLTSIAIALLVFLFSTTIIDILYGKNYHDATVVLEIQAFLLVPIFLSVGNDYLSLSLKKSKATLHKTIMGLFTNLIFNYILIPTYGILGAAVSSLISHTIANTFFYWFLVNGAQDMHTHWLRSTINKT